MSNSAGPWPWCKTKLLHLGLIVWALKSGNAIFIHVVNPCLSPGSKLGRRSSCRQPIAVATLNRWQLGIQCSPYCMFPVLHVPSASASAGAGALERARTLERKLEDNRYIFPKHLLTF